MRRSRCSQSASMEQISSLFYSLPQPPKHATERGDLMQHFIDHVNPGRLRTNRQPIDFPWMGSILKGISTGLFAETDIR